MTGPFDQPVPSELPGQQARLPPLRCTPSFNELFRYMDGALDTDHQAVIRSHLDDCGCCGEVYSFQTVLRKLVEAGCRVDLPAGLPERIFDSLDDPDPT